ncbi:Zn-ribbon domain-containing OB-fold protein [Puniceibacterium sp. IMCC21224]|uniref:Zn-ribbon domain-containing OB-fold protein n=1 Tax=Puniceibacterium sp. IMCC21224 TaxID=1618204 RepID=UPI00065D8B4A|nr:OB-fold domain-containing protein [Puniceibacterium sp. IMCC21224]KMK64554.1 protein of unknown function DUF35 [Puniceibacterium sp. IMCC21224]
MQNTETFIDPTNIMGTGADFNIRGTRCSDCGALQFPATQVCPNCLSLNVEDSALARLGTLYSFSTVYQAPAGWALPYTLGYVDLDDGVRVMGHIKVPKAQLRCGLPVKVSMADVGTNDTIPERCTYVFVPQ